MEFLPADEALRLANSSYYRQKGKKIYEDFSTVAKCCPLVAQADAWDFVQKEKGRAGAREIYDFGIGDGRFAFDFLDEVKKKDVTLYNGISYTLCDISEKLLQEAMESAGAKRHAGRLKTAVRDAIAGFDFSADYVRSNEMYDDLPAKLLVMKKGVIYEVLLAGGAAEEEVQKKRREFQGELPHAFTKMLAECEGRELVYNFGALAHLRNAMKALKKGGWIDIYDYGYADVNEAEEMPAEVWNAGTVREYGGQLTVDVNFALLRKESERNGCRTIVEPVSERLKEVFGRKFTYLDFVAGGKKRWVGYVDADELKARKAELKKAGYSEEFLRGEAEEEDCYLHMRAEKR